MRAEDEEILFETLMHTEESRGYFERPVLVITLRSYADVR